MTAQHGLDTGPETVNAEDPRFKRDYDDSEGRMQDWKRTIWGWQSKDEDRRWDHLRLEP